MIERIHRYSGLLMAILVISAIAFIFGDFNRGSSGYSSGRSMMKVSGRTYNEKEFDHLGKSALDLVYGLASRGDFGLFQFVTPLVGDARDDTAVDRFFAGRMILREAKEEMGVYPGEQEVTDYLRGLGIFQGPDRQFDPKVYQNFVQRGLGPKGMTEKDLRELASDILAAKKISEIIGSGLIANRKVVATTMALDNELVSGSLAKLELTPFQEKIEPTEEELKAYWENLKDAFTTEPKRKFTYLLLAPDTVPDLADTPDAPPTLAEAAASEEAKKAAAKKKEEERAKRAADAAVARRQKQDELNTQLDEFLVKFQDQRGAGFEDLAKAYHWEPKTTELFSLANPPADLAIALRGSSSKGKAVDKLFQITTTSDPLSKFSEVIPVGENQWLIGRLDEEEKSRQKTFEEARNEVRAQYISEKATEALKTAANEAAEKIKASITAGKSFADAAKEAGIAEPTEFKQFSSSSRPDGATQPETLFQSARYIDPGTVADVIMESDRAFIMQVSAREVAKQADVDARIDSNADQQSQNNANAAYSSWISARIEDAKVEALYRRQ